MEKNSAARHGKLKILFITPYAPTPIRTRPYHLIRGLVRAGHTITLATVWENTAEKEILDQFSKEGIKVFGSYQPKTRVLLNLGRALIINKPLQSLYSYNPMLSKFVAESVGNHHRDCDIIHIEHLRGAIYGLQIKNNQLTASFGGPIVWDSVDNISALFKQAATQSQNGFGKFVTRFELPRTRSYEKFLISKFEHILVTSPLDKEAFEQLHGRTLPDTKISVVTNGVDFNRFFPAKPTPGEKTVVFTGKLSYHANISAALFLAKEIMPFVWEKQPSTTLILAGKDPPSSLLTLAKADQRIKITGTVPTLRPYLSNAGACVAPLQYGAGVQNKVLEAMACGAPVVATPQAVSALQAVAGKDVLVANDPKGLAEAIIRLLVDESFRKDIGENGRKYVLANHDWDKITTKLVDIYENVIKTTGELGSAK